MTLSRTKIKVRTPFTLKVMLSFSSSTIFAALDIRGSGALSLLVDEVSRLVRQFYSCEYFWYVRKSVM